jgi:Fibronectin type III domain
MAINQNYCQVCKVSHLGNVVRDLANEVYDITNSVADLGNIVDDMVSKVLESVRVVNDRENFIHHSSDRAHDVFSVARMAINLKYDHECAIVDVVSVLRRLDFMKQHKLNFTNRTVSEQLDIIRRVVGGIANVSKEHRQHFAKGDLAGKLAAAEADHAEVGRLKSALRAAVSRRNESLRRARDLAGSSAGLLRTIANGEPAAMLAAGLEIARAKRPVGLPAAPANLRPLATDFEGRVALRWQRSVRRSVFQIECTTDAAARTGWKRIHQCTKQSCEVTGLVSGKKYWFRVCAVNAHGTGPWSQPVSAWVK